MKLKFSTHSPRETAALGERLGGFIQKKCVIAFSGGLGAGKTCFTAGLCRGLGYTGDVTSPTFALINEYIGGRLPIYHFDMYRIAGEDELYAVGFFDYLDAEGVTVVEWSENIGFSLPDDTVFIQFTGISGNNRDITIYCTQNKSFLKELSV